MNGPAMNDPGPYGRAMNGRAMNGPAMNGPGPRGPAMNRIGLNEHEYTGKHRRASRPGTAGPSASGGSAPAWADRTEPDGGPRPGRWLAPGRRPAPWPRAEARPRPGARPWPEAGWRADAG